MKNKVIAFLCSLFLIFTLVFVPNNSVIVNASNSNDIYNNSAVYDISIGSSSESNEIVNLNRYGGSWYSPNFDSFNTNTYYTDSFVKFNGLSTLSFAEPFTTYVVAWNFSANDGFYLNDYNLRYNGLYFDVGDNTSSYDVYLVQVNDFTRLDNFYNDTLIFSHDSKGTSYDFEFVEYSLTHAVSMFTLNISSMGSFNSQLSNMISIADGTYTINSRWGNDGNFFIATSYNLSLYLDYFNIDESFTISTSDDSIFIDVDSHSLLVGSNYLYKNDLLFTEYISCSVPTSDESFSFNQLSFIFNVTKFSSYPTSVNRSYNFSIKDFFLDVTLLKDFSNFSTAYLASNSVRFYDIATGLLLDKYVGSFIIENGQLKISYSLDGSFNDYNTDIVYNFNTSQWLNGYDQYDLYFKVTGNNSLDNVSPLLTSSCILFRYFDTSPVFINGWYTFDLEPFYSIDESFSFDLPISFTSNSIGYTNLFVVYTNDLLNYTGGQIIFTNKDSNDNVINQLDVFNYSLSPAVNNWVSLNNRQLYFDGGYIDLSTYQLMESMGTFTFISNNVNNDDFTLRDVFWSIAEVPILTIRRAFDFEILGSNVSNFVISIITVAIVLYLLRKLF